MCSPFLKRMEENYQGDLADILRASGSKTTPDSSAADALSEWQLSNNNNNNTIPVNFSSDPVEDFGDPFTHLGDPLLQNIESSPVSSEGSFFNNTSTTHVINNIINGAANKNIIQLDIDQHEEMNNIISTRPSNMFSRMLQISPAINAAKLLISDHPCRDLNNINPSTHSKLQLLSSSSSSNNDDLIISSSPSTVLVSKGNNNSLVVQSSSGNLQISSPRNPAIKRRKSQAKKVVCIPAPAPANTKSSGEVVPSDLWAWRKYGQKPIKGSPYPRGYYRCSSSKGCSARKQVERSRTDPNMLVITYTSEHNHPWPTQRNSLAGSTRSHQLTKNITTTAATTAKNPQKSTNSKEDQKDHTISIENPQMASNVSTTMKQEMMDLDTDDHNNQFDEGFSTSYKPALPPVVDMSLSSHSEDNFFADLGEIDGDPLDLLFNSSQGFCVGDDRENKTLDPFSFYDWPGLNNNNSSSTNTSTPYNGDQL